MRLTDENLKVARAVRDALVADADDTHKNTQTCTGSLLTIDLRAVIAAIPEAAPPIIDDCSWTPVQLAKGLRDATERKDHVVVVKSAALRIAGWLESIPEAAPLPAPTGPGWWWARSVGERKWEVREVVVPDLTLVWTSFYDAWVGPLAEPAGKDG